MKVFMWRRWLYEERVYVKKGLCQYVCAKEVCICKGVYVKNVFMWRCLCEERVYLNKMFVWTMCIILPKSLLSEFFIFAEYLYTQNVYLNWVFMLLKYLIDKSVYWVNSLCKPSGYVNRVFLWGIAQSWFVFVRESG